MQFFSHLRKIKILIFLVFIFSVLVLIILNKPAKPPQLYQGKIIDSMSQWRTRDKKLKEILKIAKVSGISQLGLFVRMQSSDINSPISELESAKSADDNFLFLGTPKYFHTQAKITDDLIKRLIADIGSKKYNYVSEIMLKHADKIMVQQKNTGNETFIDLNAIPLHNLIKSIIAADPAIAVQIHFELYDADSDMPALESFFRKYSKTNFVLSHMGFSSPTVVAPLLRKCQNLHVSISKRITKYNVTRDPEKAKYVTAPALDDQGELSPEWADFLVEFQDRILFATDSNYTFIWDQYQKLIDTGRYLLGKIPLEAAEKIAYKNSERLFHLPH